MQIVFYIGDGLTDSQYTQAQNMCDALEAAIDVGEELELFITGDELYPNIDYEIGFFDDTVRPSLVGVPHINFALSIRHVAQKIAAYAEVKALDKKLEKKIQEIQHTSVNSVKRAVDSCAETGVVSFDFETTGLEFYAWDVCTLLVFTDRPGVVHYAVLDREDGLGKAATKEVIKYFYEKVIINKDVVKVGQNLKFDLLMIRSVLKHRIRPLGVLYDTMVLSHLLDENNRQHNLDILTLRHEPGYYGFKKAMKDVDWATVSLEDLVPYACKDAHVTLLICLDLVSKLTDKRLVDYYHNMSMPLLYMLADIAWNGVDVDTSIIVAEIMKKQRDIADMERELIAHPSMQWYLSEKLRDQKEQFVSTVQTKMEKHKEGSKQWEKYKSQIDLVDDMEVTFNLNSNDQVNSFLNSIGIKVKKVDKHSLAGHSHPWIDLWQAYKQVVKMVNTYYEGIMKYSYRNKLYGNFLQTGTVTHRLSSADPNLQNLPVRSRITEPRASDSLKKVKSFFSVPSGYTFMAADMSQAELRTIANVSGDKAMQEVYLKGMDIHTLTASSILGMSYEEFLSVKQSDPKKFADARFGAKGANFGMVYKISPASYIVYLKQQYGITIDEAEEARHRKAIFGTYSKLTAWHNTYIAKARQFKQVRSLFGTCRRLPDIDDTDGFKRSGAEREAINAPIQATSVQYCLLSMIMVNELTSCVDISISLQIHDAIYCKVADPLVGFAAEALEACFSEPPIELFEITKDRMPVPMAIDIEVGQSWDSLKPYEYEA